jgi:chemotaxis protein methyltransferase CheR
MDTRVFERFKTLIYDKSGITLGPQKAALVSARVGKRMRALGIEDVKDYLGYVMEDQTGAELIQLLDAISTNVTSFYREPVHYDVLAKALQQWRSQGQRKFRLWCAASSTGEEPYCLAMTGLEALGAEADYRILATDISTRVLQAAREGAYASQKMTPVPRPLLQKYFDLERAGSAQHYVVRDSLRRVLSFCRLNLSQPPFPMKGPFDCVFCRNVMIYFDNRVRGALISDIERLLRPGGYLMIGHSESLAGISTRLENVQPAVYRKPV